MVLCIMCLNTSSSYLQFFTLSWIFFCLYQFTCNWIKKSCWGCYSKRHNSCVISDVEDWDRIRFGEELVSPMIHVVTTHAETTSGGFHILNQFQLLSLLLILRYMYLPHCHISVYFPGVCPSHRCAWILPRRAVYSMSVVSELHCLKEAKLNS